MLSFFDIPISIYLLTITSCLLFLKNKLYFLSTLALSLAIAFADGHLTGIGLVWLILLAVSLYCYQHYSQLKDRLSWFWWGLCVLLGFALGLHILPGFNNLLYLENVQLHSNSRNFDIWFSFDKALFGILVFTVLLRSHLNRSLYDWRRMFSVMMPTLTIGLFITFSGALLLDVLQPQLNISLLFWPWVLKNLFFTVIAEEALFRGLIQRQLNNYLSGLSSVVITALLFGFAHMAGGWQYALLASSAGFMYGYAYLKTGRIEAAIFAHLLLNIIHFNFFAYPALL